MVQIGEIEYEARVVGADDAREKTDSLQSSQEDLADSTERSAGTMNNFAGTLTTTADNSGEAGRQVGILDHDMRQLRSTASGLLGMFSGGFISGEISGGEGGGGGGSFFEDLLAFEAAKRVAGKARTIGGRIGGWIVGGINAALSGTVVGTIARALSISPAALLGATALGLMIGGLVVKGFQAAGVMEAIRGLGANVRESLGGGISDALLAASSIAFGPFAIFGGFVNGFMRDVFDEGIVGGIKSGLQEADEVFDTFVGAWERTLDRVFGPVFDSINESSESQSDRAARTRREIQEESDQTIMAAPGAQSGGMVESSGMAEIHQGEAVIPQPIVEAAQRPRRDSRGDDGTIINVENITIDISGKFDPSELNRREMKSLADRLVRAMGKKATNVAGTR